MVGNMANLAHVLGLVTGAIGGNFTLVIVARQTRFPQAAGANAIEIFAHDCRHPPHGKGLHRRQQLDATTVPHISQHRQIGPQPCLVHHKGGRIHAGQIEMGKGAGVACTRFHVTCS
jgi:hypothetical protein